MAYSKSLAGRIRDALVCQAGIDEKKMFGGVGFLLRGNMLVAVWENSLIVRLGSDEGERALLEAHVRPFDITGRPMKGWIMVTPDGVENDGQLKTWTERAMKFVGTLPAK